MNDSSEYPKTYNEHSWKTPAIVAIMVVLAVANGYLMVRTSSLTTELASTRSDVAQMNSSAAARNGASPT